MLASGAGSNLQSLLEWCATPDAPGEVVLVISNREEAGALERARAAGVAAVVVRRDGQDADALLAALREHRVELVVLAGWLKLVPAAAVRAFPGRMLNIHPALLPAFGGRGMYGRRVHEAVLAAGARVSGASVHLVDSEYDHGPILAQWPVSVQPGDTTEALAARVLEVEHRLLPAVVAESCRRIQAGGEPGPLAIAAEHFSPAGRPQAGFAPSTFKST